jgi:WbqC-like protein family
MTFDSIYLPNIEYFVLLNSFDEIIIEANDNYQKQSFRNRCKILTTNKIDDLIIPVTKNKNKEIVKNIKIDYTQDWIRRHLGAIKAGYGKAPFFEYFFDEFQSAYLKKHDYLIDLNTDILTICLKLLKIKKNILFTENYVFNLKEDYRGVINPKINFNKLSIYKPFEYSQNFGEKFVPNLSIIDTLMCQGPNTLKIIESSRSKLNIFNESDVLGISVKN